MKTTLLGSVLAASLAAGCASTTHDTASEAPAAAVTVSRATVSDLSSPFEAGGVVRARATAMIASRVLAPITQIRVRPGDRVRRGETLIALDSRDSEATRTGAIAASQSAAETARAADGDVRAAEAAVVLAQATYNRIAELYAKRSATLQELDQAVASLHSAEAQRASAQARLKAANAARDAAEASAEVATIGSTYATLSAPFDGIVSERHADPGSMATPGTPLLTLEDPASYRLEVQVDEARTSLIHIGDAVGVRLDNTTDAQDGWSEGRVVEMARVDPASHSFLVKIDLPKSSALRSGLFGRARFNGPPRRALTVPRSALLDRGQLTFVYVVDAEGSARLRPISPGASADDRVEVLAGVRDNDLVVTNPPPSLMDGSRVRGVQP